MLEGTEVTYQLGSLRHKQVGQNFSQLCTCGGGTQQCSQVEVQAYRRNNVLQASSNKKKYKKIKDEITKAAEEHTAHDGDKETTRGGPHREQQQR